MNTILGKQSEAFPAAPRDLAGSLGSREGSGSKLRPRGLYAEAERRPGPGCAPRETPAPRARAPAPRPRAAPRPRLPRPRRKRPAASAQGARPGPYARRDRTGPGRRPRPRPGRRQPRGAAGAQGREGVRAGPAGRARPRRQRCPRLGARGCPGRPGRGAGPGARERVRTEAGAIGVAARPGPQGVPGSTGDRAELPGGGGHPVGRGWGTKAASWQGRCPATVSSVLAAPGRCSSGQTPYSLRLTLSCVAPAPAPSPDDHRLFPAVSSSALFGPRRVRSHSVCPSPSDLCHCPLYSGLSLHIPCVSCWDGAPEPQWPAQCCAARWLLAAVLDSAVCALLWPVSSLREGVPLKLS